MIPLVSIISPCYNGESYVGRFLESILSQTYSNIEAILINDGSIDKTEEIILSYKKKFEDKGYNLIYIYQENAGQSQAINQALKIFTGEYLTWPDSDDQLTSDAIEKKVAYLEANPEKGLVVCKTEVVDFETGTHLGWQQRIKPNGEDCLWKDLILGINVYYSPGGYMVRSSMFRDSMPNPLQIQHPRDIGQNYQLMIPIAYKYPYGIINDVLYLYSVRKGSHSRENKTFEERIRKRNVADEVLQNIANDIEKDSEKRAYLSDILRLKSCMSYITICEKYKRTDGLDSVIQTLKNDNNYSKQIAFRIWRLKLPILDFIYRLCYKLIHEIS